MPENAGKLIRFLDQLLPFLETSPQWFKFWIYVLIFLNFVTVGGMFISYLVSKESIGKAQSLRYFSIERPENNQELPMGENQSWIIEGKFPIVADLQESSKIANIEVEVFKMPERQSIPQTGIPRISTVSGLWRFESANFAGEGPYEIIATAELDGKSDWRSINVKCINKTTAYKRAIDRDREYRGVSSFKPATLEEVSLSKLKQELHQMQIRFFDIYPQDLDIAQEIISKTLDLLDPVLPIFPNDFYLQNVRAYTFKNYAMVMRDKNDYENFQRALKEAERMFEAIRQQNPKDAGAWNGLGSIALLRNNPKEALYYIDEALEILPDYPAAIKDRETALKMLKE